MNRTEYLLVKLSEECHEVGQRAAKALTFGLTEIYQGGENSAYRNPGQLSTAETIMQEFADLSAVIAMLQATGDLPVNVLQFQEHMRAKRGKIEKYMELSRKRGILEDTVACGKCKGTRLAYEGSDDGGVVPCPDCHPAKEQPRHA